MLKPPPTLAKIIATLGPASEAPEIVSQLIVAGVTVFRFNFSHGRFEEHERRLATVRAVAAELGEPVAVLGDLPGPKIRVGEVPPPGIQVVTGQQVVIRPALASAVEEDGKRLALPCTYEPMVREVDPGHRVLINDGAIRMLAEEASPGELRCRVTVGGLVTTGKGVNLPDSSVSAAALGPRDLECVEWAVRHGLDFLALSFVRTATEVRALRERLEGMCAIDASQADAGSGSRIAIVAKIEKPQAVEEIENIIDASDAIMIARGDLGVEMEVHRVPVVQKRIAAACHDWGKPCIVATQMLETMTAAATPTRAEASDVANAIFDEVDAVMLSGETAVGRHPHLVVETMRRIIAAAEERMRELPAVANAPRRLVETRYRTAALAHGAWVIAHDMGARAVVCWSQNGGTARYLSQNNFRVPIVAYSSDARATRRMALLGGVTPVCAPPPASGLLEDWFAQADRLLVERGLASGGDWVVYVAGLPLGRAKVTEMVRVGVAGRPPNP